MSSRTSSTLPLSYPLVLMPVHLSTLRCAASAPRSTLALSTLASRTSSRTIAPRWSGCPRCSLPPGARPDAARCSLPPGARHQDARCSCPRSRWERVLMSRAARVCAEPGCPVLVTSSARCPRHVLQRHRPSRQQLGWDNDWLRLVKAAISAQPWCSHCGATADLTGDHIHPLSHGGLSVAENIQVLCRSCNARKATHVH